MKTQIHKAPRRTVHEGTLNVCAHYVDFWYETTGAEHVEDLVDRLNEEAESRVSDCINDGYVSGELNCAIGIGENTLELRGGWTISA